MLFYFTLYHEVGKMQIERMRIFVSYLLESYTPNKIVLE